MASMDSDAVLFSENLKKLLDNASNTFDGYLGCTVNIYWKKIIAHYFLNNTFKYWIFLKEFCTFFSSIWYIVLKILSKQPIIRDSSDRYYVDELQWPGKVLPDYCSGTMIIEDVQVKNDDIFHRFLINSSLIWKGIYEIDEIW